MPSQRYRLADPEHDPTTIAPLSLSNGGYEQGDGGLHKTGFFEVAPRRLRKLTKPRWLETEAASRFEACITTSFG
ncbi:hypothetical protein CPAR01_02601 [Colletotrichum paranaense]|uniref:Uncharacterized protein n=1 Tax=Colletotrichum paranaense TaxID=1914294 RepID=A0ABQ9T024_9PEZI|nr:uncharacterized protein CPAR01_02601 [Colletotrichum paranaense]KAK1545099.1 hypothetical protein CPAR01_02601 [Colletotrichum paranaense]